MAEPTATPAVSGPILQSTADQAPYVPVSWLAVAAAAVAGFFVFLLLVMGIIAFRAHRPLLEEELLIFAVLAIVLSFAARRVVRNSEGTRTGTLFGIDLPNAAWWVGLVAGLGYGSYLLAIEYSIRSDAKNEVQAWSALILKGDPESLTRAFHRTQDPNQRKGIRADDTAQLEGRWGREITSFKQCDLVRIISRNPGSKIEIGGLRAWQFRTTVDVVYSATLTCPEGTFPIHIPLKGVDSTAGSEGGRQWQIEFSSAGYIDKEHGTLTPYGWYVLNLTITGGDVSRQFLAGSSTTREARTGVFLDFGPSKPEDLTFLNPMFTAAAQARAAVVGIVAANAWIPGPEFLNYTADKLFTLPGGAKPDAEKLKAFRSAWNSVGVVRAGERLRDSADTNDQVSFLPNAIEFRSPIEIPMLATKGDSVAARGRLILICDDPSIVAEVKKLRESADPSQGTTRPVDGMSLKQIPWRVLRIESDMKPVRQEQKGPGGPGGPGGPPPTAP